MHRNGARRWMTTATLTLSLLLTIPTLLAGHEGHSHKVMGTVTEVSEAQLTLRDREGETVAIQLSDETRYVKGVKGDEEATRADVEVRSRVVVSVVEQDGKLNAKEIMIGEKEKVDPPC